MRPWHLGNTTVRSPFRLRDGLVALSTSSLQGNLRGEEQERAFRRLLGEHGIVELGDDDTYSVGRKWRSALNKLGFLYPEVPPASGIPQSEIGPIDMITPNRWRKGCDSLVRQIHRRSSRQDQRHRPRIKRHRGDAHKHGSAAQGFEKRVHCVASSWRTVARIWRRKNQIVQPS